MARRIEGEYTADGRPLTARDYLLLRNVDRGDSEALTGLLARLGRGQVSEAVVGARQDALARLRCIPRVPKGGITYTCERCHQSATIHRTGVVARPVPWAGTYTPLLDLDADDVETILRTHGLTVERASICGGDRHGRTWVFRWIVVCPGCRALGLRRCGHDVRRGDDWARCDGLAPGGAYCPRHRTRSAEYQRTTDLARRTPRAWREPPEFRSTALVDLDAVAY